MRMRARSVHTNWGFRKQMRNKPQQASLALIIIVCLFPTAHCDLSPPTNRTFEIGGEWNIGASVIPSSDPATVMFAVESKNSTRNPNSFIAIVDVETLELHTKLSFPNCVGSQLFDVFENGVVFICPNLPSWEDFCESHLYLIANGKVISSSSISLCVGGTNYDQEEETLTLYSVYNEDIQTQDLFVISVPKFQVFL